MAAVVSEPAFLSLWLFILLVWAGCAGALLSTEAGRQALVDERVRVVESLGGRVDDEGYEALQRRPPVDAYFTSGGRLLLAPPVTVAVAAGLMLAGRAGGRQLPYRTALAIVVNASVVLALQQVVATPLHFVRESLASPTNLAVALPMLEDGTWPARLFGSIEVFGLWWVWLMSLGVGAARGLPARRIFGQFVAVYVGVAAVTAAVLSAVGGS
jgi:hypothetical protein